jgi:glycine dehydrogenase subunit 1
MAGRLVGQTVDVDGRRGFVLTLAAREQHIRRERATSNICTNQALCALAAAVYMATMGPSGLLQVAKLCYHKAHYLATKIAELDGYELVTQRPFFNEFVVQCPRPSQQINARLAEYQILGGFDLGHLNAAWSNRMLICTTEIHSRHALDDFVVALEKVR